MSTENKKGFGVNLFFTGGIIFLFFFESGLGRFLDGSGWMTHTASRHESFPAAAGVSLLSSFPFVSPKNKKNSIELQEIISSL